LKENMSIPQWGHWFTTLTFGEILSIGEQQHLFMPCFV